MATYKVPQDVEADDKLIGPFSFRQFIYLVVVAMSIFIAWALSQIFIGLALIPVPIIIFFGALALPLKKDQPMEIYLAAIVSFYLKPRTRLWDPEGVESYIFVSAPKSTDDIKLKGLSEDETQKRLSYLANIVDSGGWAIRGANAQPDSPMISEVFYDAQKTEDLLDDNSSVTQSFNFLIDQSVEKKKEETIAMMQNLTQTTEPLPATQHFTPPIAMPTPNIPTPTVQTNQNAYKPVSPEIVAPAPKIEASEEAISPDIIDLANNAGDLSVATISKEANRRLNKKSQDEVFISLR